MGDYSFVKDNSGNVYGIWLREPKVAQNHGLLLALLQKHDHLNESITAAVLTGSYRVVTNTFDDQGGCFVMFGSELAPGEDQEFSRVPPSPRVPSASLSSSTAALPTKKWWQFWKR